MLLLSGHHSHSASVILTALTHLLLLAASVPHNILQAITRMLRALDETVITGVPTTGPFHKLILNNEAFRAGDVDTGFIPKHIDSLNTPPPTSKVSTFVCGRDVL
jgi:biotin carboxylase